MTEAGLPYFGDLQNLTLVGNYKKAKRVKDSVGNGSGADVESNYSGRNGKFELLTEIYFASETT